MENEIRQINYVGNALWSMARNPELNECVLRAEMAVLCEKLREVERNLTKRAADSLKAGGKSAKRKVVKSKVIRPAKSG